jgi:Ca2+-binding EF-hand superfamily protein
MKAVLTLAVCLGFALPAVAADKPKRDPEAIFKKMDKNSDGKVTKEEFSAVAKDAAKADKAFAKLDKDGDGSLTLEEFKAAKK